MWSETRGDDAGAPLSVVDGLPECVRHPGQGAGHSCLTCTGQFCALCTQRQSGTYTIDVCPECKADGRLLANKPAGTVAELKDELRSAWSYPVAGDGWMMLVALNPLIVLPAVFKVGSGYVLAVAALVAVLLVRIGVEYVLGGVPLVGGLVMGVVGLYLFVVQARIVGLLFRVYEADLGWFTPSR